MTDGNQWLYRWMSTHAHICMAIHWCLSNYRFFQNNNNCEYPNSQRLCLILYTVQYIINLNGTVGRHSFNQNESLTRDSFLIMFSYSAVFSNWKEKKRFDNRLVKPKTSDLLTHWDSLRKTMLRLILSTHLLFITIIGDIVIHAYKPVSENTKEFLFSFSISWQIKSNWLVEYVLTTCAVLLFQVVLVHGVMTGAESMQLIQQEIKKVTPNVKFKCIQSGFWLNLFLRIGTPGHNSL